MSVLLVDPFVQRMGALSRYPKEHWNFEESVGTSTNWDKLCEGLAEFQPPNRTLTITHPQRKWELVSAYQKAIRRGNAKLALHLASGILTLDPKEWKYFWHRVTTTAVEDVGPARPDLMCFVIACAHVFPPSVGPTILWKVWAYLTQRLCLPPRSRAYCQLARIERISSQEKLTITDLSPFEKHVLDVQHALGNKTHDRWQHPLYAWALKNNWRGENMLKFLHWPAKFELNAYSNEELPPSQMLAGLPDYAYDNHTRVGKQVIARLCYEPDVMVFLEAYPSKNKLQSIADVMFFHEGSLIPGGLEDPRLSYFEKKVVAQRVGWSVETHEKFVEILLPLFFGPAHRVNELRLQVIGEQQYV